MNNSQPLNPKGTWRTYTTAEGLAGLKTEHIAEDAEGFLWIGTWDSGACRFDGDEFCTFTTKDGLPSNRVQAVLLDRQGRLWFGTSGGVCWYDGKEFHRLGSADSVSGKPISFLFEDREGRLWFAGSEVLGYFDGTRVRDLVPDYVQQYGEPPCGPGQCFGITQDREGSLWFSFIIHSNLVRYDGERFHRYGQEHGLPMNVWYTVAQNTEGGVWVGAGGTLYRYESQKFQPVSEIKVQIRKIQPDREGRTWFCTVGGGVFCHDGAQLHHFTFRDGLAYDWVNAVFQDREGQLWFATWGGGLSCYDPHSIQVIDEKDGLPFNTLTTLTEDHRGHIWMGFAVIGAGPVEPSKFVSCYDGEQLEALGEKEGLDRCLTLCADSRSHLWAGGYGLQQYEGGRFRKVEMGAGQEHILVSALAADGKGALFLGRWKEGGTWQKIGESPLQITRYEGQKSQTLVTREKIDRNTYISALVLTRQGELWFGLGTTNNVGPGEGLGHWQEGEDVRCYTIADGLVDNRVTGLSEDQRGHLWITTHGGVSCFDGTRFHNYTVADGLPSNHVHSVCEDRQGRLWFGAEGGAVLYDGQVFQTLRLPEALSINDILQDRQGRFWFATNNGLVRYIPGQVPPRVRILQVVAGQVYEGSGEVSTSSQQILFEYKGMSFRTPPRDMLYTCRLLGYEEEWQKPTREMRAFYSDLPLGEYTFEVRAIDRDLNYSEPASVRLKVVPDPRDQKIDELEQRVRERTQKLEEANGALSDANKELFSLNRELGQKTRQLEQTLEEKEKAQEALVRSESMAAIGTLVAGVAHELNNPLGAAYSLVQTVQEMVEEDTAEQLQQEKEEIVGHLAFSRKELNRAKEIVAALLGLSRQNQDYTEAVELNTVVQDALRVLYNQYKKYDLNLVEEYAEGLPAVQGNFAQLGQVCMNLIKNAIEALKGMEGQIALKTYREGARVVFECADTGPGMSEAVRQDIFKPFFTTKAPGEGTGLGLYICHQTVEKHRGSIEVDSEVGKGTRFRVRLPARS